MESSNKHTHTHTYQQRRTLTHTQACLIDWWRNSCDSNEIVTDQFRATATDISIKGEPEPNVDHKAERERERETGGRQLCSFNILDIISVRSQLK